MANTFTITRDTETKTFTIERGVGRDGSDASVTLANVRAAVPNMVEVASPANDDMIQRVGGSWVTRTIAQVKTALGLGSAAYVSTSTGGNDAADSGKVPVYGVTGELVISDFLRIEQLGGNIALDVITDGLTQGRFIQPQDKDGTIAYTDDAAMTDERVPTAAGLAAKITAATSKATPVDADEIPLTDSAASFGLKKLTFANLWAWVQSKFAGASSKTTPIDADSFNIVDSADSNAAKRVTGTNLKAYLKTYLDTLYGLLGGNNTWSGTNAFSSTTRPTSSGTGTPASNSLMMLKDVEDNSLGQRIIVMPLNVVFPNTVVNSATVTTFPPSVLRLLTSNTTGSSALASANTLLGIRLNREIGLPSSYIQWSDRFRISLSFSYFNPDANTIFRFQIGEDVFKTTVSDLDQKGIGLKLENNSLKVQTHNGSSLTVSSSIATLAAGSFYDILMDSDGSGNLLVYINDTLTTTITSTGVTGYSSLNGVAVNASVTNGAGTEFLDVRLNNSIKIKIL